MSISSEITRLQNAKASIKTSIENKGVTVGDGTIDTYASKIDAIETGITPTGTINITENGTYDVTDKASANVNVSGGDVSDYFGDKLIGGNPSFSALNQIIKKVPPLLVDRIDADRLFYWCTNLEVIPALDMSGVNTVREDFYRCYALTDFGGCINLGQMFSTTVAANYEDYKLALYDSTKLTHDSLMNVINNLYDIASKGCNTQQLVLGSTNLAKLTAEEVAIGTSKGWSIS